jgi:hypothetical protein
VRHWEIFEKATGQPVDIVIAETAAAAVKIAAPSHAVAVIAKPSSFDPADPEGYARPAPLAPLAT